MLSEQAGRSLLVMLTTGVRCSMCTDKSAYLSGTASTPQTVPRPVKGERFYEDGSTPDSFNIK